MKKFISLLAVFAMLVSIFAVIPAQAEDALTGTFNIPEKSMSVLETQEIYFNFNRELTDAEAASITASCKMAEAASAGSDPWLNKTLAKVASNKGTLKTEITDDKKAVKVYFIVSGKIGWLWSGSNGNIWQITVNVNGEELGALNFATRNKKTLDSTTFPTSGKVATSSSFTMKFEPRPFWSGRNESYFIEVMEGDTLLKKDTDYKASYSSKVFTLAPVTAWKKGTSYTATLRIHTNTNYDQAGNLLDPQQLYEKTWTFTTEGEAGTEDPEEPEVPEEPEEPANPLTATFNIPEKTLSVLETQKIYLNLDRELTKEEEAALTVKAYATTASTSGGDPWSKVSTDDIVASTYSRTMGKELSEDRKSVRVFYKNSTTGELNWLYSGDTGYIWKIVVSLNGETIGTLNFATRNKKTLSSVTTDSEEKLEVADPFVAVFSTRAYWSTRNEEYFVVVKEGDTILTEGTDYTKAFNSTYKELTITPVNGWKSAKDYTVDFKVNTKSNYAADGSVLEPYTLYENTWGFTVADESGSEEPEEPEEPEVPAEPITGTFNMPEKSLSVLKNQEIYLNLDRTISEEEEATIKLVTRATTAASNGSDPWAGKTLASKDDRYCEFVVTEDRKAIEVFRSSNGEKVDWFWDAENGWIWYIEVQMNGSVIGTLNFATVNRKTLKETTADLKGKLEVTDPFVATFSTRPYYSSRNEAYTITVMEGDKLLAKDVDYKISTSAADKTFTVTPIAPWKEGADYTVRIEIFTKTNYDASGNLLSPCVLYDETMSFSTVGGASEPELPTEGYGVNVTKNGETYSVAITSYEGEKTATVILIGKSANKLNSIKVYNNVSLSSTAVEKDITVGAGEIFEAFIFENGTLVPVLDTKILYAE